jgi:hypothetical protein
MASDSKPDSGTCSKTAWFCLGIMNSSSRG